MIVKIYSLNTANRLNNDIQSNFLSSQNFISKILFITDVVETSYAFIDQRKIILSKSVHFSSREKRTKHVRKCCPKRHTDIEGRIILYLN